MPHYLTANPRTLATLKTLESVEWFTHCGVQDAPLAVVLESLEQAMAHCVEVDWENLRLEAANELGAKLMRRSMERYNLWNDVVIFVKPLSEALVDLKARPFAEKHGLTEDFLGQVKWDILHMCIEAEYADLVEPSFYASLSNWYSKGHFPCGWQGSYPEGKMVIY